MRHFNSIISGFKSAPRIHSYKVHCQIFQRTIGISTNGQKMFGKLPFPLPFERKIPTPATLIAGISVIKSMQIPIFKDHLSYNKEMA